MFRLSRFSIGLSGLLCVLLLFTGIQRGTADEPPSFPPLTDDWCANVDTLDKLIAHFDKQREPLQVEIQSLTEQLAKLNAGREAKTNELTAEYKSAMDALRSAARGEDVDFSAHDPILIEVAILADWQIRQLERSRDVCNNIADATLANITEAHFEAVISQNKIEAAKQARAMVNQNRRERQTQANSRVTRLRSFVKSSQQRMEKMTSEIQKIDKSVAAFSEGRYKKSDPNYQKSVQTFVENQQARREQIGKDMGALEVRLANAEHIVRLMNNKRLGAGTKNITSGLYAELRKTQTQLRSAYLDEYDPFMDPAPGSEEWLKRQKDPAYARQQDTLRRNDHARAVAAEATLGMDPAILMGYDIAAVERETLGGVSKIQHYRDMANMYDGMARKVDEGVERNLLVFKRVSREEVNQLERERHGLRERLAYLDDRKGFLEVYRDRCRDMCEGKRRASLSGPPNWDSIMVRHARNAMATSARFKWQKQGRQMVTAVGGKWSEKSTLDPPHVYGTYDVPAAGKLQAVLNVSPPAPNKWSLGNADTQLVVKFQPKIGDEYGPAVTVAAVGGKIGPKPISKHEGEGVWSGAGRLSVFCGAAGGSGPLSGGQFDQAYHGFVEILETYERGDLIPPHTIQDNDQLTTEAGGELWLATPLSSVWVGPKSDLTIKLASDSQPRHCWELHAGKVRVTRKHEEQPAEPERGFYEPGFEFALQLKGAEKPDSPRFGFVIRPQGTDFSIEHHGETAEVRVFSGEVEISGDFQRTLRAGETLTLPSDKPQTFDAASDPGLLYAGVPVLDVPLLRDYAQPDSEWEADFVDGEWANGWIWQDPGNDVTVERGDQNVLRINVPHGNDFWQHAVTGPRLLHEATGDFQLDTLLEVKCEGRDLAIAEFLLFSPESMQGLHAKQMASGPQVDYRLVGGGWTQIAGNRRLPVFGRDIAKGEPIDESGPIHFRLTREGDLWRTFWSRDGEAWNLSGQQVIDTNISVWVGLCFKRVAHDRLFDEPLVCELHDLRLRTGVVQIEPPWMVVSSGGEVQQSDPSVTLALGGSQLGGATAYYHRRLEGDVDVVVRYDLSSWDHHPGEARSLTLGLDAMDDAHQAYVGLARNDGHPKDVVRSDIRVNRMWRHYNERYVEPLPTSGYLRLIRKQGHFTAQLWREGRWEQVGEFRTPFDKPVYLYLNVDNQWRAKAPSVLSVDFELQRIRDGIEAISAPDFIPDDSEVLVLNDEVTAIDAPEHMRALQWNSPFPIGGLFTDSEGRAYVFSTSRDRQKVVRLYPSGDSMLYMETPAAAGLNRKAGAFGNDMFAVALDYWPQGGTLLGGLYEVSFDAPPTLMGEKLNLGDLADLAWHDRLGWVLCDMNTGQVLRVPPGGKEAESLWREGLKLKRSVEVALDPDGRRVFVLDQLRNPPTAEGGSTIAVLEDGVSTAFFEAEGSWFKSIAYSPGGSFDAGLYALDSEGRLLALGKGTMAMVMGGLTDIDRFRFGLDGELWLMGNGESPVVIYLENPLVAFLEEPETTRDLVDTGAMTTPPVHDPPSDATEGRTKPAPTREAPESTSASVQRLGVVLVDADSQVTRNLPVAAASGAVVVVVQPGTAGAEAGLKPADVLFRFGDVRISQASDVATWLDEHEGTDPVLVKFQRGQQLLSAVLEPRAAGTRGGAPRQTPTKPTSPPPSNPRSTVEIPTEQPPAGQRGVPRIGMRATSAGTPEAHRLGVESPTGAVVTLVHKDGPAHRAGLRVGDNIVSYEGVGIDTYEDFEAAFLRSEPRQQVTVIFVRGVERLRTSVALERNPDGEQLYKSFHHRRGGYRLRLPSSWQEPKNYANGTAEIVSINDNYRLYCLAEASVAAERVPLDEYVRRHKQLNPKAQGETWRAGPREFAFVAFPSTGGQRGMRYAVAIKASGKVVQVEVHAPVLSDPAMLPIAIRHVVETLEFVGQAGSE